MSGLGQRVASLHLLAAVLLVGALPGCGPRYERLAVVDQGGIRVQLRSQKGLPRGFDHPATISGVRLAHILGRIDVRMQEGKAEERTPAVATELVFGLGEALSKALAKAGPDQEVVAQAVRTERNLGVFTQKYLTGLVAWVEGEKLVIHLSHVNHRMTKSGKNDRLPEPWVGETFQAFKVLPATEMVPRGPSSVAVRWRAPIFRRVGAVRRDAQGRVQRRTILMESAEEPGLGDELEDRLPRDLSPERLRELADLEETRRSGGISEVEYERRRQEILFGGAPAAEAEGP